MIRSRRLVVSAIGLGLVLGTAACGSSAGHSTTARHKAAPPKPPVATIEQAVAVERAYATRNDAGIRRSLKPSYKWRAEKSADMGWVLATDRYSSAAAKGGWHEPVHPWHFARPQRLYAPLPSAGPAWFLAAGQGVVDGHKPRKASAPIGLVEFDRVGGTWRLAAQSASIKPKRLPAALPAGTASTATGADQAKAVKLAHQIAAYWARGKHRLPGFASPKLVASLDRTNVPNEVVSPRLHLYGPPRTAVRTVRTAGGLLVLASYRLVFHYIAINGSTIFWKDDAKAAWGASPAGTKSLTGHDAASYAFVVPRHGKARILSEEISAANF